MMTAGGVTQGVQEVYTILYNQEKKEKFWKAYGLYLLNQI